MFVREVPLKKEVPLGAKAGLAAIRSEAAKMSCVLVTPASPRRLGSQYRKYARNHACVIRIRRGAGRCLTIHLVAALRADRISRP
jgi:hypothetical protein